jgi:hypothetical protein
MMFLGMKRSSIRRVELPSQLTFRAREDKQLPLPSEKNEEGNRYAYLFIYIYIYIYISYM